MLNEDINSVVLNATDINNFSLFLKILLPLIPKWNFVI